MIESLPPGSLGGTASAAGAGDGPALHPLGDLTGRSHVMAWHGYHVMTGV